MNRPSDDDPTMLVPTGQKRPPSLHAAPPGQALPVGTRLAEFEITGVLGAGGFGIVYLAYDRLLERHVAVKEFMPSAFALRDPQGQVRPAHDGDAEAFGIGLHSFVNEARLLAQFDAPSLLKVYRFWEENGTAYMVMPYYGGRTLKQVAAESRIFDGEAELRRLLDSILDALAILHAQQCYHRDIAPDNILMLDDDRPVLLDFGAARRAIGDMTQVFTTIFKQAYAPVEQISESANMRQGPWTDLFALAGVIHFLIDGQPPPPAVGRVLADSYVPLAQRYAHRYSPALLNAIDRALAVRPKDRPQSVQEMRALLGETAPAQDVAASATEADPPPPARRRWPLAAAAALGVALAGGLAFQLLRHQDERVTPAQEHATPPARPGAREASVAPPPSPSPGQPGQSAPSAEPAAPVPPAFDPDLAFDSLIADADPDFGVEVSLPQAKVVIAHDLFSFTVRSRRAGYVYVYMLGNEHGNPQLIFPGSADRSNRIEAGQALELPRPGSRIEAGGPPGVDRFVAMVSALPRDFKAAGLVAGRDVSEFPMDRLKAAASRSGPASPLAGSAVCRAAAPCSQRYGAAGFTIEEVAAPAAVKAH